MVKSWQLAVGSWQKKVRILFKRGELSTINYQLSTGFTLIEMIVSVALFAVVMVVAVGALLSLTGANKKAQALQSVMNNLNISVDNIVRSIRMGSTYTCASTGSNPADCNNGDKQIIFTCNPDTPSCAATGTRWSYGYNVGGSCPANAICKSTDPNNSQKWARITAPEVTISDMKFFVVGSTQGDAIQPKVIIVVKGEAGAGKAKTTFHIQATAVQRELDL